MKFITKSNIALFIALLFHVCGAIGILFTPYKDWFIQNTPVNLLLMCFLLLITHSRKYIQFILFFVTCYVIGFIVELIGVNTKMLFGQYQYGNVLGYKFNNVPLLIGVNWFIIIYCCANVTEKIQQWFENKYAEQSLALSEKIKTISFIIDASLLAVSFDYILEPVAVKLNFWQWQNNHITFFNYSSWFVISSLLVYIYKKLKLNTVNSFAVHLFIIQLLFFIALNVYL
jgi:putative membrane protein